MSTPNYQLQVDYSPANKYQCAGCHRMINAGELRAGTPATNTWKHIDCLTCSDIGLQLSRCFTALIYQQKQYLIENFVPLAHLSSSDQQTARNILFALAMSGWQHHRQSQQTQTHPSTPTTTATTHNDDEALLRKLAMNAPLPCSEKEHSMHFSSPPRHPVNQQQRQSNAPSLRWPAAAPNEASFHPPVTTPQRSLGTKRRSSFDSYPCNANNKRRR